MGSTFTLLIFEAIGISTDLFLIPNDDITPSLRDSFSRLAGLFLGEDIEESDDVELKALYQLLYVDGFKDYKQPDDVVKLEDTTITNFYLMGQV